MSKVTANSGRVLASAPQSNDWETLELTLSEEEVGEEVFAPLWRGINLPQQELERKRLLIARRKRRESVLEEGHSALAAFQPFKKPRPVPVKAPGLTLSLSEMRSSAEPRTPSLPTTTPQLSSSTKESVRCLRFDGLYWHCLCDRCHERRWA